LPKEITTSESLTNENLPSTQGITSKVVKGSFWTLIGQVLPLIASFFATPFLIRLLGSESYGVYVLIVLIPTYFLFSDFGMSLASTKFASEAYGQGLKKREGEVIRMAALIAFISTLPFALGIFISSDFIIDWFNVPVTLHFQASLALKITAISFLFNVLINIFNTPQLSRLRMDLNSLVTSGFKFLGIIIAPIVLYFGGNIVSLTLILLITSLLTLAGHIFVSSRLLKELLQTSINKSIIKPMLKFGGALVISGIAGIILVNLEKIVLASATSVESLAYYSVAFTFASMTSMFSGAMIQSLLPAFSQLLLPEKKSELNKLFSRTLRFNIIGLIPLIVFLFVIAKPFLTAWAGEIYGQKSTLPFYILLSGLFFNVIAYIPYSLLMASGRSDLFAKIYWFELFPYILLTAILTSKFGAVGAALSWSIRVITDALIIIWLSKRIVNIPLKIFQGKELFFGVLILSLLPPILIFTLINNYSIWLIPTVAIILGIYFAFIWLYFLELEEKELITRKIYAFVNRNHSK
jgi:O-antigen/teichoic acid export membrane protein